MAFKLKRCAACKVVKPLETNFRFKPGHWHSRCTDCSAARIRARDASLDRSADPPTPASTVVVDTIRARIDAYTPIRFAGTPEADVAYRRLRDALRDYGAMIEYKGRVWRYDRGLGDLTSAAAPPPHSRYPKDRKSRRPAPAESIESEATP